MSAGPMAGMGRKVVVEKADLLAGAAGFSEDLWRKRAVAKAGSMPVQTVVRYFWPSGKRAFILQVAEHDHAYLGFVRWGSPFVCRQRIGLVLGR